MTPTAPDPQPGTDEISSGSDLSPAPPPAEGAVLGEGEPPPPEGLSDVIQERPPHPEKTRRHIAQVLVWSLVGLTACGAYGWLRWGGDTPRMQNFAVLFAPITTLFGTVIGFYFSSGNDKK